MKKQCCTVFLLLVLSIQILPLRQMGSLLFSNQFTEELPHTVHLEKTGLQKAFLSQHHFDFTSDSVRNNCAACNSRYPHFAVDIPLNYSPEIHVPPPNC